MITSLLTDLRDYLLSQNAATFQHGYALLTQYQDGKVVAYEAGEGTYQGLSDTDCNFFYLRYAEDTIDYSVIDDTSKLTACTMYQGVGNIRLVAWVQNGDFDRMGKVLINDILSHDYEATAGFDWVDIPVINSVVHQPETIFKEETLLDEERVRLAKNVTLIAIDFSITFANTLDDADCENRNLCVDQCT